MRAPAGVGEKEEKIGTAAARAGQRGILAADSVRIWAHLDAVDGLWQMRARGRKEALFRRVFVGSAQMVVSDTGSRAG